MEILKSLFNKKCLLLILEKNVEVYIKSFIIYIVLKAIKHKSFIISTY